MCGFAGLINTKAAPVANATLRTMAKCIAHRGPDGEGVWAEKHVGLSHRRLSVIDVSTNASQPMIDTSGRFVIAFNGEIYNYLELRKQLETSGVHFRTSSDTEVILEVIQKYGSAGVEKLDGMFAFALWDREKRELLLARDRSGKKPLFVYQDAQRLIFGSEMKSILAVPGVDKTLWPLAPAAFLLHGYVPTPATFYQRIRRMEPGSLERFSDTGVLLEQRRYWQLPVGPSVDSGVPEAAEQIRTLFTAGVKRRMVADVPLGAFLSGGVDSSLVVATMAKLSSSPVKTFSIGFADQPDFDETKWAREVSRQYQTTHTEFIVEPDQFKLVDTVAGYFDEPFGDASALPSYLVAQLTRKHVTVALTGDGGDEVFGGYPRLGMVGLAHRVPGALRSASANLLKQAIGHAPFSSRRAKISRNVERLSGSMADDLSRWVSIFPSGELNALFTREYQQTVGQADLLWRYRQAEARAAQSDPINRAITLNFETYLLDDLNPKVDQTSMAVGLETRAPFLDTALMNFVSQLPGSMKMRPGSNKWILKKALGELLPDGIANRKKMGFGLPLGAWFRGPLKSRVSDVLLSENLRMSAYLDTSAVRAVVHDHFDGHRDRGHQLWSLLALEQWLSRQENPAS